MNQNNLINKDKDPYQILGKVIDWVKLLFIN